MELSRLAADPTTLLLGGKDYRLGKIRPRDIGILESWFKEVVPNPKVEARRAMEGLPSDVQIHIWDQAVAQARFWPPTFGSEEGQALLKTSEGIALLVHLSIRQTVASFSLDDARDLADQMEFTDLAAFLAAIFPAPDDEDESGPKATAVGAVTNPTGTV